LSTNRLGGWVRSETEKEKWISSEKGKSVGVHGFFPLGGKGKSYGSAYTRGKKVGHSAIETILTYNGEARGFMGECKKQESEEGRKIERGANSRKKKWAKRWGENRGGGEQACALVLCGGKGSFRWRTNERTKNYKSLRAREGP